MRRVILFLAVLGSATAAFAQQPRTSGSITAGGVDCSVAARCVGLAVGANNGAAAIVASGFGTATITIEVSTDATSLTTGTWTAQPQSYNLATGALGSTFAANGYYVVPMTGATWVRARASAYTSGTISILLASSSTAAAVAIAQPLPTGSNTIGAVTLPANASMNETQLGGTAIDTNSGNKSAGTQRVVIATDQPALTNALKVDPSGVTSPVSGTVTANAGTNLNTSALALDATVTGRLPAGATPADAESNTNPNLSRIGGMNYVFNGTTWDRWRGDTTNGAWVNVKTSVLPTGAAQDATLTGGTAKTRVLGNAGAIVDFAGQNAASPANSFLVGAQFNTTPTTLTTGNASPLQLDSAGNLLVNIKAGGGTGGGPADVGVTTAASETDANRQKVTAALRLLDTAQGAGSQLVGAKGDQTSGLWVNCKAGCSAAGDTTGSTQTYNANNQSATVTMAGENAASVALTSAASPVLTLVGECSVDGGTTYGGTVAFVTAAGVYATSLVNPANATYALIMPTGCAGATNVRVRTSAYTSGTIVGQLRATANSPYANPSLGAIGANSYPNAGVALLAQDSSTATTSRAVTATANGVKVDGSAVTQPVSESGTWTVQPGNTANTTPWLVTPYESGANLFPAAAALADGTANPTTTGLATFNMCFNGTTWDRCKSSSTNSGTLDSGTQRVTLATNDGLVGSIASPSSEVLSAVLASGAVKSGAIASGAIASGAVASGAIASGAVASGAFASGSISDGADVALGATTDAAGTGAVSVNAHLRQIATTGIPVSAALPAGGNTIGKVDILGNGGATVDSTVAAGSAPTNAVAVGSVYNSTAPAPTNGQAMAQQADQAGNLREFPGTSLLALAAWNSATALNATQTIYTNSGAGAVALQLTQTSTLTAGAVTVEVSFDGTNWAAISADAVLDPTSTTLATISLPYTVQATTNKTFLLLPKGAQAMRVKLSTQITGSGTVTPNYALIANTPVQQVTIGAGSATIGSLAANQSVNIAQMNGVTTTMGNGVSGTGVQRVTIASDSTGVVGLSTGSNVVGKVGIDQTTPGTTNAVAVTNLPTTVTLNAGAADASTLRAAVDVRDIAGSTVSTAATGVQKVGIVGNAGAAIDAATGAAPPANALLNAGLGSGATGGLLTGLTVGDSDYVVNISTATTTLAITGVSGRKVRITHLDLLAAAADNVAIIEGTGATCGTGTAGMSGGTTAASGYNFAANGGISAGVGLGEVMATATTGDSVCIVTSAATQLSGHIKYSIY